MTAEASTPRERPIIFSAPMVRALLVSRKTQTRRIIKFPKSVLVDTDVRPYLSTVDNEWMFDIRHHPGAACSIKCPYGVPGDVLYARETWGVAPSFDDSFDAVRRGEELPNKLLARPVSAWKQWIVFRAGGGVFDPDQKWRRTIHMPKWAARIWLRITDVRVQRVQDISEEDARAEGVEQFMRGTTRSADECRNLFAGLWDDIHGPDAWARNDWVWAISFERTKR